MNDKVVNGFLVGTLALILVAGLGTPAFAVTGMEPTPGGPFSPQGLANPQHGNLDIETIFSFPNDIFCTDILLAQGAGQDYIPNANNIISLDVELRPIILASVNPITVNIYDGSLPITLANNLLGSTSADTGFPPVNTFGLVHFDFAAPVPLTPGQPHVIELVVNDGSSVINWAGTDGEFIPGGVDCFGTSSGFFEFLFATYFGEESVVVGGELLPIDTTALMLAGLQSSAIWMLPVLAGVAGSAFAILYIKSRRN